MSKFLKRVLCLAIMGTTASGFAESKVYLSKNYKFTPSLDEELTPSFNATLINSRELKQLMANTLPPNSPHQFPQNYNIQSNKMDYLFSTPTEALNEEHPLCRDLGYGCLIISYLDHADISTVPLFETSNQNTSSSNDSATTIPDQIFMKDLGDKILGDQCFKKQSQLVGALITLQYTGDYRFARNRARALSKTPVSCAQEFSNNPLNNVNKLNEDAHLLVKNIGKILSENIKISDEVHKQIKSEILENPRTFADLPGLFQVASPANAFVVDGLIQRALLLTLETLTNAASSTSCTYAYYPDNLINKDTLLKTDSLYEQLNNIGRWPKIVGLSPSLRNAFKGPFLEKTSDQKNWRQISNFVPATNTVYIDYYTNFYEAVYSLQHELWHVAWEHSESARTYNERLSDLLSLPQDADSDMALRQTMYFILIQNEHQAFEQQNLLYHFSSELVHQWGSGSLVSAKPWHDSEFGIKDILERYIPYEERLATLEALKKESKKPRNQVSWWAMDLTPVTFFLPIFIWEQQMEIARTAKRPPVNSGVVIVPTSDMDKKIIQNLPHEMQFFSDRYFITIPDLQDLEVPFKPGQLQLKKVDPVQMKCADIERVKKLLPKDWDNGTPFRYVITDNNNCPNTENGSNPENSGSHPENSGSHPEINGAVISVDRNSQM